MNRAEPLLEGKLCQVKSGEWSYQVEMHHLMDSTDGSGIEPSISECCWCAGTYWSAACEGDELTAGGGTARIGAWIARGFPRRLPWAHRYDPAGVRHQSLAALLTVCDNGLWNTNSRIAIFFHRISRHSCCCCCCLFMASIWHMG